MPRAFAACSAIAIAALLAAPALGDTWFVDATAPAGGTGHTWTGAFNRLQDALAAALPGDEVRVAAGTYRPALAGGPTTATFTIPADVAARGGYAGRTSATPDTRTLAPNSTTTLSGDLAQDDASGHDVDNVDHVVTSASTGATLDGFVITGGVSRNASFTNGGGGIKITAGNLHVLSCEFVGNTTEYTGGGAAVFDASPVFENCIFRANQAQGFGGGALTIGNTSPVFRDCLFEANVGGNGCGLCNFGPCSPLIERCVFRTNQGDIGTASGCGAIDMRLLNNEPGNATFTDCLFDRNVTHAGGGGLLIRGSNTTIRRCTFVGNRGDFDGGGGLYVESDSNVTIDNCVFTGNKTSAAGSAIFLSTDTHTLITNCTIANNGAPTPPFFNVAAIYSTSATFTIANSILWNNRDTMGGGGSQDAQISSFGPATLTHNIIDGWTGTFNGTPVPPGNANTGNDPLFTAPAGADGITGTADDDFRLATNSPAINAGLNSLIPPGTTLDIALNPRIAMGTVDIGAFERLSPADVGSQGGLHHPDGLLDNNDFIAFIDLFFTADPRADLGRQGSLIGADGAFNNNDFVAFIALFFAA